MTVEVKLGTLIGRRRSIRRYRTSAIRREAIERLLLAATQAPSAHNRQPWRFAVIDDHATKETLATAMGQRLRQDRVGDGDDPVAVEADVSRSFARITGAPTVVWRCVHAEDANGKSPSSACQSG